MRTFSRFESKSFAGVYREAVSELIYHPQFVCNTRGHLVREIIGTQIRIRNPYSNLFKNSARDLPEDYLKKELLLYFNSIDDAAKFIEASSVWENLANADGTINSAYGYLIFGEKNEEGVSQWQWALDSLVRDRDSRQAIMYLGRTRVQHPGIKDFICTVSYQFFIREYKLWMVANRRSQDIHYGLTFDIPWEMLLMQQMKNHLADRYPGLELGEYVLNCGSLHLYEKNLDVLKAMERKEFVEHQTPKISPEFPLIAPNGTPIFAKDLIENVRHDEDPFLKWLAGEPTPC